VLLDRSQVTICPVSVIALHCKEAVEKSRKSLWLTCIASEEEQIEMNVSSLSREIRMRK